MADRARRCWKRLHRRRSGERGVSLLEMVGIVGMAGLILAPLLSLSREMMVETRVHQTARTLDVAREALIDFAARHDGRLPFAADDAVDGVVFASMTPQSAGPDEGQPGDDTLFAESFTRFKQGLNAQGVRVEPISVSPC